MAINLRGVFPWLVAVVLAGMVTWAMSFGTLPPADFTFVNGTEIRSIDPHIITGQPEGRIAHALFEGLCNWHPEDLRPVPGVAERWDISEDGRVYTFYLRTNARWTDGTPVTAHDFHYSLRRLLDPMTAGEYAYQGWYLKNAQKYTSGESKLEVGDPVEVELPKTPESERTLPGARGEVLYGTLVAIERPDASGDDQNRPPALMTIEIDGQQRKFQVDAPPGSGYEPCRQVLFDFRQVGVEVVDDHTLRLTLENRTPYFLQLTGFYPLFPVNRRCVETHGYPAWTEAENLVSNGAFRMQFRRIRDRIRLVRNEHYWNRENVKLATIDALSVESDTTTLNLYMTGQADWIPNVPTTAVPKLLHPPRPDFNPHPEMTVYFYRLNTDRKPFDDPRVRRALAMALNKREIVEQVTQAGEVVARSLVPPGLTGYEPAEGPDYNPEEARRLLAEAGYPGGRDFPRFEIMFNALESHATIAQLIQAQWAKELGLRVGTRQLEWNAYQVEQQLQQYWVARAGWVGDYLDPNTFLDMFVTGGANNQTGWGNPRYDELIAQAAAEEDPERRMAIFHEAETILMEEMPIIPIYFRVSKNMVRPYVRGFYGNLQDVHPLEAIWIDEALRDKMREEGDWR